MTKGPDRNRSNMPTQETKYSNDARMVYEAEVDISAAAAVTATRGKGVTCVKSATGTYTFVFKGNTHGQRMFAVLNRDARLNGTYATATGAAVRSVTQNAETDDVTVVVMTVNAANAETATTGACVLSLELVTQASRMTGPFD